MLLYFPTPKAKARLINVVLAEPETVIYDVQHDNAVQAHPNFTPAPLAATDKIKLNLITPLHLQKYGKVLADDMTAKDLLMALTRRYYLLQEFHGQNYQAPDFSELAEHALTVSCEKKLTWCHLQRYSTRQQQKMRFDGVLGSISLTGELQPFLSMLQAGQWLHIGNKTSFGMGHYTIDKP